MIDIIIPIYNAKKTLPYTLMSICMQTIKDKVNVLLVDDSSKEEYGEIIKKYSKEIKIKIVRLEKNSGPGIARQYGMEHSRSKYICFMDSDDLFNTQDSLELLYNEIEKGNDLVYSSVYHEDQDKVYQPLGDLHGKIYRRNFIIKNKIHFNETRYHEDNAFNNLVIVHGAKMSFINHITYDYLNNRESTTKKELEKGFDRLEIYIDNMEYVVKEAEKHQCSEELIIDYIYRHYGYLNYVAQRVNMDKKNKIKSWLKKYDFMRYLEKLNGDQVREIAMII